MMSFKYIRDEWKENVKNFKYKGSDSSIFYVLWTNPFCNFVVSLLPDTLPANYITLMGLINNILIFCITCYYSGLDGKYSVPSWACYFCSFLYFSYHMLDNIDGKQARKTNASSPLGMMFDHGCDALVTFLFTMGLGTIVRVQSSYWFTIIWFMACIPFFLNTWEEYYTGELNFPLIHGVSEGTLAACIAMCLSGYYGDNFLFMKINLFGQIYQLNHIIVMTCFLTGLGFAIWSFINVILKFKEKRHNAYENLFIFMLLISSLLIVINYSDSQLVAIYPKILILLYGFAFAKLVGHLQLAHICDAEFLQYRKSFLSSFVILAACSLLKKFYGIEFVNIDYLISGFLVLHIVVWMHFVFFVSEELCEILGIYIFTLTKRNKKN